MSEKLLTVSGLSVTYASGDRTVRAVNSVSLDINRGETLGLVGETGAGKTTFALSLMRLLPKRTAKITSGSVEFEGIDILSAGEGQMRSLRGDKIAMIFQDPMTSLDPVRTVGNQIGEALRLHSDNPHDRKAIESRVEEMLETVGIPATRKNEFPHQFSGGMKQRVLIAMALSCSPELLIADEPTTALDVTIQAQVLALMGELQERMQMAMLLITHDLGVVAETCDTVAVMYAGEIVEYGKVEDIFGDGNHHPYTRGLFAAIPSLTDTSPRLHPIDGLMPDPTDLPPGCSFAPRCPECMEICRSHSPKAARRGEHIIKCHLFGPED